MEESNQLTSVVRYGGRDEQNLLQLRNAWGGEKKGKKGEKLAEVFAKGRCRRRTQHLGRLSAREHTKRKKGGSARFPEIEGGTVKKKKKKRRAPTPQGTFPMFGASPRGGGYSW